MEQKKSKSKFSKIGPGPFKCASCFEEKDKKEFSRKQILNENRNCRTCVDKIVQEKKILPEKTSEVSNKNVLCFNCKKRGHVKNECLKKGGGLFNPGGMSRKMK